MKIFRELKQKRRLQEGKHDKRKTLQKWTYNSWGFAFDLLSQTQTNWRAKRDMLQDIFLISMLVGSCEVPVKTWLKTKLLIPSTEVLAFRWLVSCSSSVYHMTCKVFKPLYCFVFIVNKLYYLREYHGLNTHENIMWWKMLLQRRTCLDNFQVHQHLKIFIYNFFSAKSKEADVAYMTKASNKT